MTLKLCKCGTTITTKNAERVIRDDGLGVDVIYLNCPKCKSTLLLKSKGDK